MLIYRITHKKWADKLSASGYVSRWNSNGVYMIYAAENRSLACLENLVHRNGFGFEGDFSVMTIEVPDTILVEKISQNQLPQNWNLNNESSLQKCRIIGDSWIKNQSSAVLIVPSANSISIS